MRRSLLLLLLPVTAFAQQPTSEPRDLPDYHWHLTARPWQPVDAPERQLVDEMERAVRALAPFQHWNPSDPTDPKNGAIIDPFDNKEIQYGTPCFAFNVATLLAHGRGHDLVVPGIRALDNATLDISTGYANDFHGEFFCAPLVKAISLFESVRFEYPEITAAKIATWKQRMTADRTQFMALRVRQNWRTFAMKGEWLRQQAGYIHDAIPWIEADWTQAIEGGQRERFRRDLDKYHLNPNFFLFHDDTANPETFAYNGATTANLLDMLESGYNGPSAGEMRGIISHNLRSSLFLLSGAGEAPAGGRTGEHIWDDSIYANAFQLMAEAEWREGDKALAGQFRHAVELLIESHARFQQENGLFSITKNLFPASLKNRYASWSGVANYEDFTLSCCAEVLYAFKHAIPEQPIPSEIGGYAVTLDPSFANSFIDAGGMQAQICTRGEIDNYGGVQWHVLGITRFSRTGWDGRLGPGAGHVMPDFSDGVSFSPAFLEDGVWKRVCLDPKRFQGEFTPTFVHPLLVKGTLTIAPVTGQTGPSFAMDITLTPDGALIDTARASGTNSFGIVWPLFQFDGRTVLSTSIGPDTASTAYPRAAGPEATLPATAATLSGGARIATNQPGYDGKGFVPFPARGAAIEWSHVDGGAGGPTSIGFRYSLGWLGSAARKAKLIINGVPQPELAFLPTGDWRFWHQLYLPVTLTAGKSNTIDLVCDDSEGGALINDLRVHPALDSTPEPDQENFIALRPTHQLDASAPAVRGGYGDFLPIRVTDSAGGDILTFVYPRSNGDPTADAVRASFVINGGNFSSTLGRVVNDGDTHLYIGRNAAGGYGQALSLKNDNHNDITFSAPCNFILQLKAAHITAVETDRPVTATLAGKTLSLAAHSPVHL